MSVTLDVLAMSFSYNQSTLPRLALPDWLHAWSLRAPPPATNASVRVLVVAYGLIRSLRMLETTLASLVRFAPANVTLAVRADVPERLFGEALVRQLQGLDLRIVNVAFFSARVPNGTLACNGNTMRAAELSNELRAAHLLLDVRDEWNYADVAVLWRIDTELVSPMEAPALPPDRVLVPYLQSGGQLNDRYLVGNVAIVRKLVEARASLLAAECVYGEPALVRLLRELQLRVGFTRTRIVRRRADLWIPDVDRAASLGSVPARSWMKKINTLSPKLRCDNRTALCTMQELRVFGVHGSPHSSCPFLRSWESRCVWSERPQIDLPPLPSPRNASRGRLLVMGDSMDAQLFVATACHLWEHQRNGMQLDLRFEADWMNSIAALRKRCGDETTKCHYERASLCVDGKDAWRVPFRSMHLCQGDRATCMDDLGYNPHGDWVVTGPDALHGVAHSVRGAMGRNGVPNRTVVAAAARRDVNSMLCLVPASALVWREATAQHFHAPGGHWTHGFMLRSNVEKLEKRCAKLNHAELERHAHWNPVSTPLMTMQSVRVLHTWDESARAWYAHVDHGDCTHFCQPSPLLNGWAIRLLRLVTSP